MGNTSSSQGSEETYKSYIQQQFQTIQLQQQQIQQLIQSMNSNQSQATQVELEKLKRLNKIQKLDYLQNIQKFKKYQEQQRQNSSQLPEPQPEIEPQLQIENKLDPFQILNISKQYDKQTLKKKYLQAALRHHPDRGGSEEMFQKVSIAYTVLLKKLDNEKQKDHNVLKHTFKKNQTVPETQDIKMNKDRFNVKLFNQVYDENRMEDIYDKGYGDWFQKQDTNKMKQFTGNISQDKFNREFNKYKRTQKKQSKDLVVRDVEESISYHNSDSIVNLGQKKVKNFSGSAGGLGYRDLKDAYENSTLIDVESVDISKRDNDVRQLKVNRSNISYDLSPSEKKRLFLKEQSEKKWETQRLERMKQNDEKIFQNYQRIHNRLMG